MEIINGYVFFQYGYRSTKTLPLTTLIYFFFTQSIVHGFGETYPYLSDLSIHDDDMATKEFHVDGGITMGKTKYHTVFASTNGIVTFDTSVTDYVPTRLNKGYPPMIAVFWTDLYTAVVNSNFYYNAYTSGPLVQRATDDVRYFGDTKTFKATWLLVATWHNASYYCCRNEERITIQCVVATNGDDTYVMFNYIDVQTAVKSQNVAVGWRNNKTSYEYSLSFTSAVYSMSTLQGNVGRQGFLFFKIGNGRKGFLFFKIGIDPCPLYCIVSITVALVIVAVIAVTILAIYIRRRSKRNTGIEKVWKQLYIDLPERPDVQRKTVFLSPRRRKEVAPTQLRCMDGNRPT